MTSIRKDYDVELIVMFCYAFIVYGISETNILRVEAEV